MFTAKHKKEHSVFLLKDTHSNTFKWTAQHTHTNARVRLFLHRMETIACLCLNLGKWNEKERETQLWLFPKMKTNKLTFFSKEIVPRNIRSSREIFAWLNPTLSHIHTFSSSLYVFHFASCTLVPSGSIEMFLSRCRMSTQSFLR